MKYEICKFSKSAGVFYAVAWTDSLKYGMEVAKALTFYSDCRTAVRDVKTGEIVYEIEK